MNEWSNLKEVARTLDVHYMTAYKYVRQGRLPATWADNGWRVHRNDLESFQTGAVLTTDPDGEDAASVDWAGRLAPLLVNGDEVGSWSVIESALAAGVDAQGCYINVLSGALAQLGEVWGSETGDSLVDERLATATALRIVHRLGARFSRPGRRKGSVVFGSPIGERHTLPVAIAADLIRLGGYTVLELGPDVSAATFLAAAQRTERLVAVGISLTTADAIDEALTVRRQINADLPDIAVLVGGQAVSNPEVAAALGSHGWAKTGADIVSVLDDLATKRRSQAR